MGCFPEKGKKKIISNISNINEPSRGNTNNDKRFIYVEGILVKERNIDPMTLYDEISMLGEGAYGKVVKVRHKISKVL